MDLSVVIVNWNTRDLLRACLHSLQQALGDSALRSEVIVVDNASADGSADMVAAQFPQFRLMANTENRNYAAGNNQGLAQATGEFQLLLNPDTEVPLGACEALIRDLRDEPAAGAAAPALVYPDGRLQDSVRGFPTPRAIIGDLTGLARMCPATEWASYRTLKLPQGEISRVDQPMASAFLVRRSALEAIGLFDEQFPLFFNDVDLCFRLREAGWEILYDPRVRVVHAGGGSTRQVRPRAILMSHAGLRRFYAKHFRSRMVWPLYAGMGIMLWVSGWLRAGLASAANVLRGGN